MSNSTVNVPGIDKRRQLRKSAAQEELCLVELGNGRTAMLLDVSELGIGVQSAQGPGAKGPVPVRFMLPGTTATISAQGEIAWTDRTGCMGIRFTTLTPDMKQALRKWVQTDWNPLLESPADSEQAADEEARDRVAQFEARILLSGWTQVPALNFLVDQIAAMTQASGVAIAVEDGQGIICKASSGIAPQVGVRINPRSGLSWECARTGDVVHCVDTETDPRVDRIVCRQLTMRSAMLVPVKKAGRVAGLVEVFSSRPRAFSTTTIVLLKRVAEAVASLDDLATEVSEEPQIDLQEFADFEALTQAAADPAPPAPTPRRSPAPPAVAPPFTATTAAAPALAPIAPTPISATPIDVPLRTAPAAPLSTSAAKPAPPVPVAASLPPSPPSVRTVAEVSQPAAPVVKPAAATKLEPKSNPTPKTIPDRAPSISAPLPQVLFSGAAAVPEPVPAPKEFEAPKLPVDTAMLEEFLAESAERPSWRKRIGIAAAAVLVVSGVGYGVWVKPAANSPEPIIPPAQSTTSSDPADTSSALPSALSAVAPAETQLGAQPNLPVPAAAANTLSIGAKPARKQAALTVSDPAVPFHAMGVPSSSGPKLAAPVAAAPILVGSQNSGVLTAVLGHSVAVPGLEREHISEGISGGEQIVRIAPVYPPSALTMHISGTVVLRAHIDKSGSVSSVEVVSGHPMLAAAAVAAVHRWKYRPFRLNGNPVENVVTVQVNFTAPR